VVAAARLVDERGIDALNLSRLAEDLGVSQPALYKHISSSADLLAELALLGRRKLLAALTEAAVGRERESAMHAVGCAWRDFARQHPGLYAATDRARLEGSAAQEQAVASIVGVLGRIAASYGIADDRHVELAAWALRSALHGFAVLEAERGHPSNFSVDHSFDRLIELLATGLAGWE
jgi:AcrR family transcriptional regulator